MLRSLATLCLLVAPFGCMATTTHFETRSTGQSEVLMESGSGLPAIMGDFVSEPGLVRGHVAWTMDCRRAVLDQKVTDEIKVETPKRGTGVGLMILGIGLGALGTTVLSTADDFSDEQTCSTDIEGNYSCSSPRQNVRALGAVGVATGFIAAITGAVTVASRPRSSIVSTESAPPSIVRVTQDHAACGAEPVRNLGLSLTRAGVNVAASSTNDEGDVAFAVPPSISGRLVVVVDAVPPPFVNIRVGDIVGSIEIVPKAGDAQSVDGAKRDAVNQEAPNNQSVVCSNK